VTPSTNPSVLISYSHDSPEHEQRVLEFCNRLRARGVDAFLDQFLPGAPSEGWPLWMERQIEQRDFTLMVCTEAYRRRFMEDETAGVGLGVVWEARILRNLLYNDAGRHSRIVPILLTTSDGAFVPTVFRGHFYDVSDERGFESLLRHLLAEPKATAATLGALGPQGSRWSAFERPWLVPDALRTSYFTGRDELLARLRLQLSERGRAALSGLGGVGKTQTAIEYAVRHRADYPDGVSWINAETTSGLTSGFAAIASTLSLPAAEGQDQEEAVKAVLAWLNGTDGWLLVMDNVDDRGALRRFVPERNKGHVLITSRESVFQELGIARALDVTDLGDEEAVRFLLLRTGRRDAGAELTAAAELAAELGNLPLALEQAAAYIVETNTDFAAYLRAFRKRRVSLLERAGGLVSHETVAVTWAANFEAAERASLAAADVLRISAFLGSDAIPFEIFLDGAAALGGAIAEALVDPDELSVAEMLRPLTRYSLIRSDPGLRAYSVHRLVQEIVRAATGEAEAHAYVDRAVAALDATLPKADFAAWPLYERLIPHVMAIAQWVDAYEMYPAGWTRISYQAGFYLRERGRYTEAEELLRRALSSAERAVGPKHPDVAACLNGLGVVVMYQGRYAEAQSLHERALAIRERSLGPDDLGVADSLNNLGLLHGNRGRHATAAQLYERASAIYERVCGPTDQLVAMSINNVAHAYGALGRYAEAKPLFERALATYESAVGAGHPDVAYSLNGLAVVLTRLGQLQAAEPLFRRALALREQGLGPEHPAVGAGLISFADNVSKQGRYAEGEALLERALAIFERAHGRDHPEFANGLLGLASLRTDQGRTAEAIALHERALAVAERTFPPGDPYLAEIRADIDALRGAM
jgi:tetratricopeptide (TPR) repeat protein